MPKKILALVTELALQDALQTFSADEIVKRFDAPVRHLVVEEG
jgi:hypothetical protein